MADRKRENFLYPYSSLSIELLILFNSVRSCEIQIPSGYDLRIRLICLITAFGIGRRLEFEATSDDDSSPPKHGDFSVTTFGIGKRLEFEATSDDDLSAIKHEDCPTTANGSSRGALKWPYQEWYGPSGLRRLVEELSWKSLSFEQRTPLPHNI